jgi:hypothetical protein
MEAIALQVGEEEVVEVPRSAQWGVQLIRELTRGEVLPPFNVRCDPLPTQHQRGPLISSSALGTFASGRFNRENARGRS